MMYLRIIPLALAIFLISFILIANLPSLTCNDPAGCILLQPGEVLSIGIMRVSSGPGQKSSLEIQQGAEVALRQLTTDKNFPEIVLQPFFAPCLSESESGSSIESAGTNQVLLTLGSGCAKDEQDFILRMARASKIGFTPLSLLSLVSNNPNTQFLPRMAQQAAAIIETMQFQSVLVTSSSDELSTRFQEIFCQALEQQNIICQLEPEVDATIQNFPKAKISISLAAELTSPETISQSTSHVPTILIALSKPQAVGDPSIDVPFWIGPTAWKGNEFLTQYLRAYQTVPESLEAQMTYESMSIIMKSLLVTSRPMQGGFWIIPRQAFNQSLAKNLDLFAKSTILDCNGQPACGMYHFSLYKLDGNEYKSGKP